MGRSQSDEERAEILREHKKSVDDWYKKHKGPQQMTRCITCHSEFLYIGPDVPSLCDYCEQNKDS